MSAVKEKESTFEAIFAHDQEMRFLAEARRNALIGLWAAALMQKSDAEAYAVELREYGVENPNGVLQRLSEDFQQAGIAMLPADIHNKMTHLLQTTFAEMARAV
ncbi:DUF1476 domain-containing protein [Allorhizobium sp. BGMRC 0089]|uniref:DUF1476 domain-containing protein n=1 Tax=Allorhizobium sonneratiae TaxID=2934936 RepID=UPI002033AE42|nr:DUF1476 domain-containing protein [Allorhizobium sonneratiae]MCM2294317.1 DUF1476 domain-containing protein [Allorhizobium sonneratiae]